MTLSESVQALGGQVPLFPGEPSFDQRELRGVSLGALVRCRCSNVCRHKTCMLFQLPSTRYAKNKKYMLANPLDAIAVCAHRPPIGKIPSSLMVLPLIPLPAHRAGARPSRVVSHRESHFGSWRASPAGHGHATLMSRPASRSSFQAGIPVAQAIVTPSFMNDEAPCRPA